MATKTAICNLALSYLGVVSLTDVDTDTGPVADYCRSAYEPALREALALRSWAFSSVWSDALTELTNDHPFRTYKFQLPAFVRINRVCNASELQLVHEQADDVLYADEDVVYVNYVSYNTDTTTYPALFVAGFSYLIASYLAFQLHGDAETVFAMRDTAMKLLDTAKDAEIAGSSAPVKAYESGDFLASFGG